MTGYDYLTEWAFKVRNGIWPDEYAQQLTDTRGATMVRTEERAKPGTVADLEPGMTAQLHDDAPWLTVADVERGATRTRVRWHGEARECSLPNTQPVTILTRVRIWS